MTPQPLEDAGYNDAKVNPHANLKGLHPLGEVLGHATAIAALQRAFNSDRLHHAYLLHGPEGVGKHLTAICFAQALLCSNPRDLGGARVACGDCRSCIRVHKVRAEDPRAFHPDLHIIRRDRDSSGKLAKEIKIQPIRELQKSLSFGAFEGGRRVVIIEEVERFGLAAANALLKTLEEPLPEVHFLLTTTSLNSVLPTIKSRAQGVRFGPLSAEIMERLISEREREVVQALHEGLTELDGVEISSLTALSPPQRQSLAQLSGGSIGRALKLYHQGGLSRAEELITKSDRQGGPQDLIAALGLAPSLNDLSEEDLTLWFHLMRCWYRDALIILHSAHDAPLFFPGQQAITTQRGQQLGAQRLMWRLDALDQAEHHLFKRTGSNRKLILEALLLYLAGFDTLTHAPLTLS